MQVVTHLSPSKRSDAQDGSDTLQTIGRTKCVWSRARPQSNRLQIVRECHGPARREPGAARRN